LAEQSSASIFLFLTWAFAAGLHADRWNSDHNKNNNGQAIDRGQAAIGLPVVAVQRSDDIHFCEAIWHPLGL
jgi:hypothetical protein